jgi:dienelactone hydrolase
MRLTIAVLALSGTVFLANGASAAESIAIPQAGHDLRAVLFRPQGAGPFPGVVALHACEGLFDSHGRARPRYRDWGERLAAAGFAVLFPDSYGSRGLGSVCRVQKRKVRASRQRVSDANAARHWLQDQSWIVADRVSLLGFATGAVAALWAVRRPAPARNGKADFRSAVAFYPGCRRLGVTAWSARVPTLILIGAKDDWTPAKDCQQMVAGARGRSARVAIHVYPGAHHDFDRLNLALHLRTGLAYTRDGSGRAHVGSNAVARADAIKRTRAWLAR